MVDFDDIDEWAPQFSAALRPHVPDSVFVRLATATTEYIDDSRDMLLKLTDRDEIIEATLRWIRSTVIAGYHGTRLTDAEILSVRAVGLIPLKAEALASRPR